MRHQISSAVVLVSSWLIHVELTDKHRFLLSRSVHYSRFLRNWKKKGDFTVIFHFVKLYLAGPSEKKFFILIIVPSVQPFHLLRISLHSFLNYFPNLSPLLHPLWSLTCLRLYSALSHSNSLLTVRAIVPSPRHPLHSHSMIYLGSRTVATPPPCPRQSPTVAPHDQQTEDKLSSGQTTQEEPSLHLLSPKTHDFTPAPWTACSVLSFPFSAFAHAALPCPSSSFALISAFRLPS